MNLSSCAQFSCVPSYGRRTPTLFWIAAAVAIAAVMFLAVPSIISIRRRNPGILDAPATALAGCTEGRPVDDEAR